MRKPDRGSRTQIVTRGRSRGLGIEANARGRLAVGIALAVLALVGASAAYAAVSSSGGAQPPSGAQVAATPAGPGRLVRAYGLDPTLARVVSTLRNGDNISVVDGPNARCLIRQTAGQTSNEACAPMSELTSVRGITVTDECGSAGAHLMEITGLAPEAATSVRLIDDDGTARTAPVEDGTFKFDGTNPRPNEPYPTVVEWRSETASLGRTELPVAGNSFCLPAE